MGKLWGIYENAAEAIQTADTNAGVVLNRAHCTLSQILYQTGAQRPVIVKGEGGAPKVIVGFDGYNTYLYDPSSQTTVPMGMNDSTKAFEENGNVFICYMEKINE